jgi:aspartate racemase
MFRKGSSMHIGIIGGIGPAATDFYYRRFIRIFALEKSPLDLTIVHADTPTLLDNQSRHKAAQQAAIFAHQIFHSAANRLIEERGADAIMLGGTDLALIFDEQRSSFPLIDCAAIHADAIARRALSGI